MTCARLTQLPVPKPLLTLLWFWLLVLAPRTGISSPLDVASTRCVLVEFYYDSTQQEHVAALNDLKEYSQTKLGLELVTRDIHSHDKNQQRLQKLAEHFKFETARTPVLYTCNRIIHFQETNNKWREMFEDALVLDVYTRIGCSRCVAAKKYMEQLLTRYPAFKVRYRELTNDVRARNDLDQLVQRFKRAATSTPVFHFIDSLVIGFDQETTSGPRIEGVLKKWTVECVQKNNGSKSVIKPVSTSIAPVSEVTNRLPF